jgi:hypothetical protein
MGEGMAKGKAAKEQTQTRRAYALHARTFEGFPAPRHLQAGDVAVIFDPDGGENGVVALHEGGFWAAGMVAPTVQALIDRLWRDWYLPTGSIDSRYERAERGFADRLG